MIFQGFSDGSLSDYLPSTQAHYRPFRYGDIEAKKSGSVIVLKFQTLFSLFSNKMLVIRAGIHKMLVRIANRGDSNLIFVLFVEDSRLFLAGN